VWAIATGGAGDYDTRCWPPQGDWNGPENLDCFSQLPARFEEHGYIRSNCQDEPAARDDADPSDDVRLAEQYRDFKFPEKSLKTEGGTRNGNGIRSCATE